MGSIDEPINENGTHQAKKVAAELEKFSFDIIYASPKIRAIETAQEILRHQKSCKLVICTELRERDFGHFEGRIKTDKLIKELESSKTVEPAESVSARLLFFLKNILDLEKNTLIVSHSSVYKHLVKLIDYKTKPHNYNLKNSQWVDISEIRNCKKDFDKPNAGNSHP